MRILSFISRGFKLSAPRIEDGPLGTPASPGEGSVFDVEGEAMARRGYNTAWMWKRWQAEKMAARHSRASGQAALGQAHEDLAAVYHDIGTGLECGSAEMEALAEKVIAESDETLF